RSGRQSPDLVQDWGEPRMVVAEAGQVDALPPKQESDHRIGPRAIGSNNLPDGGPDAGRDRRVGGPFPDARSSQQVPRPPMERLAVDGNEFMVPDWSCLGPQAVPESRTDYQER